MCRFLPSEEYFNSTFVIGQNPQMKQKTTVIVFSTNVLVRSSSFLFALYFSKQNSLKLFKCKENPRNFFKRYTSHLNLQHRVQTKKVNLFKLLK